MRAAFSEIVPAVELSQAEPTTVEHSASILLQQIAAEGAPDKKMQAALSATNLFRPLWDQRSEQPGATPLTDFIINLGKQVQSHPDRHALTAAAIEFVRALALKSKEEAIRLAQEINQSSGGMMKKSMGQVVRELQTGLPSREIIGNPDTIVQQSRTMLGYQ